jgi:hypothetical protein
MRYIFRLRNIIIFLNEQNGRGSWGDIRIVCEWINEYTELDGRNKKVNYGSETG